MEAQQAPEAPPAAPAKGRGMWIGVVVVAIVIVILLAAVFGGLLGGPPAAKDTELRIGTVLSLTGNLGIFGVNNEKAAKMAIEEINAAGGVLGTNITAFHEDDATTATTGRDAAQKLITTNHVDAIVGATGSGVCLQVLAVAKANNVFQISGSCTSPAFSDPTTNGGWFARTAPSDALQGTVAADFAYHNWSWRRMAVIGNNNPYGNGLADVFEREFVKNGGTITIKRIVQETPGATTYVPDLTAVQATNPEAIYLAAYPNDARLMLREWDQQFPTWNVNWTLSEGMYDPAFFNALVVSENIPAAKVETLNGTAPADFAGIHGPRYAAWASRFTTRWSGASPGLFSPNVYDATYLVALAAQAAGEATGAAIKSKIRDIANPPGTVILPNEWAKAVSELNAGRDINYEGAAGAVDLDTYGDPLGGYIVWSVDNVTACGQSPPTGCVGIIRQYTEDQVVALLTPAPPMPAPGTRSAVEWEAPTREG